MFNFESDLVPFVGVVLVDLALASDNAVVVGLIASGVDGRYRRQVLVFGIVVATVLRISFSFVAVSLLSIVGLLLAGGLLLLWVAIHMWRDIRGSSSRSEAGSYDATTPKQSPSWAIFKIGIADISMSLDNVIAVAGTARQNVFALVFGLALSIVLMAVVANRLAVIAIRYPWLNYPAIAVVAAVALSMIWEGGQQVADAAGMV